MQKANQRQVGLSSTRLLGFQAEAINFAFLSAEPTLRLTRRCCTRYGPVMTTAEFITETGDSAGSDRLPASDLEWQAAAYAQFLRDDPAEDAIYERLR